MDENNNFENFFKENLKGLNIEPSTEVWKGVKHNLWYSDIQNLFYSYTIQPASNVWRMIAFKLWFKEFVIFSPKTFNIYYLSSVIVAISLMFYSLNNFTDNNSINKVSNQTNVPLNKDNNIIISDVTNNNSDVYTNKHIENKKNSGNTNNDNSLLVSYLNKNNSSGLINKVNNNNNIKNNNKADIKSNKIDLEPIIDNNEIAFNDFSVRDYSSLSFMLKQSILLNNNHSNDSVFTNRKVVEYNPKWWYWSIESYFMPLSNSAIYKVKDLEFSDFNNNINGKTINTNTLSGGILAEAKHLNFSFQTGVSYSKLADKPNEQYLSFRKDSILVTQIEHGGYYHYFEIEILNLDTLLLTGHYVYITIHDSEFVATTDTISKYQSNIVKTINHNRTYNSFSYIEVPLIAGYTFSQGRINLTLRAGLVAGILTKTTGSLPSPYSEFGTIDIDNNLSRKIIFSGIAGIEVAYDATKHISIIAAPIYRFNLSSVFKKEYVIDERFKSIGFKLGLKYKLN